MMGILNFWTAEDRAFKPSITKSPLFLPQIHSVAGSLYQPASTTSPYPDAFPLSPLQNMFINLIFCLTGTIFIFFFPLPRNMAPVQRGTLALSELYSLNISFLLLFLWVQSHGYTSCSGNLRARHVLMCSPEPHEVLSQKHLGPLGAWTTPHRGCPQFGQQSQGKAQLHFPRTYYQTQKHLKQQQISQLIFFNSCFCFIIHYFQTLSENTI